MEAKRNLSKVVAAVKSDVLSVLGWANVCVKMHRQKITILSTILGLSSYFVKDVVRDHLSSQIRGLGSLIDRVQLLDAIQMQNFKSRGYSEADLFRHYDSSRDKVPHCELEACSGKTVFLPRARLHLDVANERLDLSWKLLADYHVNSEYSDNPSGKEEERDDRKWATLADPLTQIDHGQLRTLIELRRRIEALSLHAEKLGTRLELLEKTRPSSLPEAYGLSLEQIFEAEGNQAWVVDVLSKSVLTDTTLKISELKAEKERNEATASSILTLTFLVSWTIGALGIPGGEISKNE